MLERALRDESPALRRRAALAIGRLQDSTRVPQLLPLLQDRDLGVRREAIFALGQTGHRSARAALEAATTDRDAESVALAIEALGKLQDPACTPVVAAFLADRSPRLRGDAAIALWRLADSTALAALLDHHEDADPEVRWRVLYALEKIVAPDKVVRIVATHLGDNEWLCRAYAARTLGRQKSSAALAYLVGALRDPEPAVTVNVIRSLQLIADSSSSFTAKRLLDALGHGHAYVRQTAAGALADRFAWAPLDSAGRADLVAALRSRLSDSDPATRGAAARALIARLGGAGFESGVDRLLDDPSVYVRVAVMNAVGNGPASADWNGWLETTAKSGRTLFERMTAADLLGQRHDRGAVELLRAGLADTSALYASACASGLAALPDSASVPLLARVYGERAGDADADARISIRDALRELAGRAFADSVERSWPAATPAESHAEDFADPPRARRAILHTSAGDVEWEFYGGEAPQTVKNFVRLARRGYFDGTVFHRVVPNFVIQDGDPTGTGSGGPGYSIRCEYNALRYEPGMVGMALSGKDTGGSQWFITHSPQHHLDGRYTIFAHVTRGMDVVHRIAQGDRITRVEIVD